jgi:C-terminal processing protease CtpA/Prc
MGVIDDVLGGSISDVIDCILSKLRQYYVLPEAVPRIEDTIRQRRENGEYDGISSGPEFAGILTAHLREASQDKHFFVRYSVEPQPLIDVAEPTPEMREEFRQRAALRNFGFYKIERLPGNIGYLDLRTVSDPDLAGETAIAAMQVLAHTHALIIDLRKNGGGKPAMVALLCSCLLDAGPVRLNDFYWRAGDRIEQSWTLRYVPGRRYGNKPVYVLTSHETVSGGEELAYNLQALKRATLIGETTAGAAHLAMLSRVTAHVELSLPTGRPINPLTGTNWEGTGVVPDITVPQEAALKVAHIMALKRVLETVRDRPAGPIRDLVEEAQTALTELEEQCSDGSAGSSVAMS